MCCIMQHLVACVASYCTLLQHLGKPRTHYYTQLGYSATQTALQHLAATHTAVQHCGAAFEDVQKNLGYLVRIMFITNLLPSLIKYTLCLQYSTSHGDLIGHLSSRPVSGSATNKPTTILLNRAKGSMLIYYNNKHCLIVWLMEKIGYHLQLCLKALLLPLLLLQ